MSVLLVPVGLPTKIARDERMQPQMRRPSTKGFTRTSALLRDRVRKASETRGFAETRVLTHWAEIVGTDIAEICVPVDVKYARGGFGATLSILTTGAQAPMLEMQKDRIRERINAAYGYSAISRVRITQTAPTGFAEGQVAFHHKGSEPAPEPDIATLKKAEGMASPVRDPELRDALERLAENVLTKPRQ